MDQPGMKNNFRVELVAVRGWQSPTVLISDLVRIICIIFFVELMSLPHLRMIHEAHFCKIIGGPKF